MTICLKLWCAEWMYLWNMLWSYVHCNTSMVHNTTGCQALYDHMVFIYSLSYWLPQKINGGAGRKVTSCCCLLLSLEVGWKRSVLKSKQDFGTKFLQPGAFTSQPPEITGLSLISILCCKHTIPKSCLDFVTNLFQLYSLRAKGLSTKDIQPHVGHTFTVGSSEGERAACQKILTLHEA